MRNTCVATRLDDATLRVLQFVAGYEDMNISQTVRLAILAYLHNHPIVRERVNTARQRPARSATLPAEPDCGRSPTICLTSH